MDPNETVKMLLDAANRREVEGVEGAAEDLADWLRHGGFAPDLELVSRDSGEITLSISFSEFGELVQDLAYSRESQWFRVADGDGREFDLMIRLHD
jgi:predicted N-acetyltransferase YhbS